jgi:hypothetical protein
MNKKNFKKKYKKKITNLKTSIDINELKNLFTNANTISFGKF